MDLVILLSSGTEVLPISLLNFVILVYSYSLDHRFKKKWYVTDA